MPAATRTGDTWYSRAVDLSAVAALNNNPSAIFRVVSAFDPAAGQYLAARSTSAYLTTGTMRFDNVTVTGTPDAQPPADLAPSVISVVPANGATDVAVSSDLAVTFSEPVNVSGNWFTLACAASGTRTVADVAVSGGPTSFTLNPNADFAASEACTFTVIAAQVTDLDTNDPPETMAADFISGFTLAAPPPVACSLPSATIGSVQGTTDTTPVAGQTVSVQGAVIADFEYPGSGSTSNFLRGFYMQDAGDGDPNTSDGIFVFNGNNNSVSRRPGRARHRRGARVSGPDPDQRHRPSNSAARPAASPRPTSRCPSPAPTTPSATRACCVRFPQPLFVTEHFQLGRFGQVVMSSGDRLRSPTQRGRARARRRWRSRRRTTSTASSSTTRSTSRTPIRS